MIHKTKEHKAGLKAQMEAMAGGPMPMDMMEGPMPSKKMPPKGMPPKGMPKMSKGKKAAPKKASKGKSLPNPKY